MRLTSVSLNMFIHTPVHMSVHMCMHIYGHMSIHTSTHMFIHLLQKLDAFRQNVMAYIVMKAITM